MVCGYSDVPFECDGYVLHRSDRLEHAGGVAIFVSNKYTSKLIKSNPIEGRVEYLFLEVVDPSSKSKMLICCIYRPHRMTEYTDLLESVSDISVAYEHVILAGDLNSNMIREQSVQNDFNSLGLSLVNCPLPTHFTSTCSSLLDVFQLCVPAFSKHDLIFMTYDFISDNSTRFFNYRDYKSINLNNLLTEFDNYDWTNIYDLTSPQDQLLLFNSNIRRLFEHCVRLRTKTQKPAVQPWFNLEIKKKICLRDNAYKRWKRYKTESLHIIFKQLRNLVTKSISSSKRRFYNDKFANAETPGQVWKDLRSLGI
ncbi:uncharacterized protein LOC121467956 isoform X1 [Drosophila elegans]|uniref:uncharacterized protein LOC121467956 isoform X1 n=1 Tax=Drosophila elegans TaxID=30023 RepID=UPI001BC84D77|nr:uncharacterized protein LOC121467956 isoform X1 [Drosophila elegans]